MRYFVYILGSSLILFSCIGVFYNKTRQPSSIPSNKSVQEIRFVGWYRPEPIAEEQKNLMLHYKECIKEAGKFEENPDIHCDRMVFRKKPRLRFEAEQYCYESEHKTPVFNKNLKARLYDKEENVLAEDYLRCLSSDLCHTKSSPMLIFYLPYFEKADKVQVIKIQGAKEILLNEEKLSHPDKIKDTRFSGYSKKTNCHSRAMVPRDAIV